MADFDKVTIERLGDDNYETWSLRMKYLLIHKKLWAAVTGDGAEAGGSVSEDALALIGLFVRDQHLSTVAECKTAHEAWTKLEGIHKAKTHARRLNLKRELNSLRLETGESLTKYVARARGIKDSMVAAGYKVEDDEVVLSVLSGLPSEYDMAVTAFTAMGGALQLDDVQARLLQVEQQLRTKPGELPADERAYVAKTKQRGWKDSNRKRVTCYYCGKQGHIQKDCRKKAADSQGGSISRKPAAPASVALAASVNEAGRTACTWVVDSGASRHMASDPRLLQDLKLDQSGASVTYGNGARVTVAGTGTAFIRTPESPQGIQLRDVLYVPAAKFNLFSITCAVRNGARVTFLKDGCELTYGGKLLARAHLGLDGLCTLETEVQESAEAALIGATRSTAALWHRRYGHLGYGNMANLVKQGMVSGIDIPAADFTAQCTEPCEPCIMAKQHRLSFGPSETETVRTLELVHMDVCGPLPASLGGARYFATFLDDYSKFSVVRPIASKSDVAAVTREVIQLLEAQAGQHVRTVRTDNGSEYLNSEMSAFFRGKGITHQTTVRYTPEQNGAAERLNRTILERVRAMLDDADLSDQLWAEAAVTANYIRLRSPVNGKSKTPWELFNGTKPNVDNLRVFGAPAYAHVPDKLRSKLSSKSLKGTMVGYPANTKGYRILLPDGRIIISRDVIFDEAHAAVEEHWSADSRPEQPTQQAAQHAESEEAGAMDIDEDQQEPMSRRRQRHPPTEWWVSKRAKAAVAIVEEPANYKEAVEGQDADKWRQAMDEEMTSLMTNNTWALEPLPDNVDAIPVKWVYKVKKDENGNVQRYKARLVAKGFKQREGVDFDEVYAPVSKHTSLRALLAIAAERDLELHQLDVKTAFLNGELEEDVYVQQPPGYQEGDANMVCHLKRALYGLRQAPRTWHLRLKKELETIGYQAAEADPGLFINNSAKYGATYLLVYVDDMLVTAMGDHITYAKKRLMELFEMRDLGEARTFLGMTITRDRGARTIKLDQATMTTNVLKKFNMDNAKPKSVPISPSTTLRKEGEPLDTGTHPYGTLIGSLLYLSTCTRPDIAQPVGALSKYLSCPTMEHWQAAKGVLRYLAGTADYGITFGGQSGVIGYCDSDSAGDVDTRRSTTGYVFILNGGAIDWSSRRQPTVAASTTEAEYMAAAHATKEALWIHKLLLDFGRPETTIRILADNQGAIKLIRNPISSVRSKHIDVMYHFVRERAENKEVSFEYIPSDKMIADVLTKPVPLAKLTFCLQGLGMI